MGKHADIIERLEKAEGPDRAIDVAIALATKDYSERAYQSDKMMRPKGTEYTVERFLSDRLSSRYTGSLDAAIALVERMLPGWKWSLDSEGRATLWNGRFGLERYKTIDDGGRSSPAALLITMFRALGGPR